MRKWHRPTFLLPACCSSGLIVASLIASLFSGSCSTPPKVPFTHLKYWNGSAIPGYYYSVGRGDTLASIAQYFNCDLDLLARMNDTVPNRTLGAAERIFIPRTRTDFPRSYYVKPRRSDSISPSLPTGTEPAKTESGPAASSPPPTFRSLEQTPQASAVAMLQTKGAARTVAPVASQASQTKQTAALTAKPTPNPLPASIPQSLSSPSSRQKGIQIAQEYSKHRFPPSSQAIVPNAPRFQWPVEGNLSSTYNVRSSGRRLHLGIDIANKRGTPVRAAFAGRVIYSDNKYLPSMGNMILVEHSGGWITLYAHNDRNLVKEGDVVETGQMIAGVGMTGNATGPHLHFEIRKNAETPVNPLDYLPPRR